MKPEELSDDEINSQESQVHDILVNERHEDISDDERDFDSRSIEFVDSNELQLQV